MSYDVAIIGSGTAGLSALHQVRKQTDNFVIINHGPYGTTCARVGCMPSKALIESANAFHRCGRFEELGIHGSDGLEADVPAVLRRVRLLRDRFVAGAVKITDEVGPRSIAGRARFIAPDAIEVGGQRINAKTFIIATGSRPIVPAEWVQFGSRVLTSDTLFEQERLPASVAVVGLGVVGCEIAQALSRLGIRVTAFGAGQAIAGLQDPVVTAQAASLLGSEFAMHLGAQASVAPADDRLRVSAGDHSVTVDGVFVALGRRPNIDGLGLENIGATLDDHGMPDFNPQSLQIATTPIYFTGAPQAERAKLHESAGADGKRAVLHEFAGADGKRAVLHEFAGDVNGEWPVLHEANDDGYISGYNALRDTPECFQRRTPLAIVFTNPNIAVVGERFAELDPRSIVTGEIDFSQQSRALIAAENHGMLRVYADRQDARLLGAEMCAPRGEHLAHLLALAVGRRLTVHELLGMPFYHPVFEEGLRTALRDCSRQLGGAPASDLANCDPIGATALD